MDLLYIGIPSHGQDTYRHTGDLITALLKMKPSIQPALDSLESYRLGDTIIIGTLPNQPGKTNPEDPWQFTSYPVSKEKRSLKVRLRSEDYFVDEEGTFRTEQMYGNIMHRVFSQIAYVEDVGPILEKMEREGIIPRNERVEMQQHMLELISKPHVMPWFTKRDQRILFNERSVFCGDGKVLRPDRVILDGEQVTVIDFKFGQVQKASYIDQVRNYMIHMEKAGYRDITGYIWYVMLDKKIQIEWK
jgi:hypothetical protein